MKTIKTYCPECDKETVHIIWTEDAYGAHGVAVVHNPKCHCNLNEDY